MFLKRTIRNQLSAEKQGRLQKHAKGQNWGVRQW